MISDNQPLDIQFLRQGYRAGRFSPGQVIETVLARIQQQPERCAWITRLDRAQLEPYLQALHDRSPDELPLFGIPFAIKDNIDLAGVPTTAGCAEYSYLPERSAFVVQRLIDAGAIPIGKTNLDQFATGLVGTRSPYGACRNSFDVEYIAGGSSSGSAVAVACGQVSFALGTDTAGSGRVPAAFNNLIGLKPSRGVLSTSGVVPACRTLDCVSVFALSSDDAACVYRAAAAFDADDPYARAALPSPLGPLSGEFRFAVPQPEQLQFFGDGGAAALFQQAVARLQELGGEAVIIDFAPFMDTARLLYGGPWLAERYAAVGAFIAEKPQAVHPVTHTIIAAGAEPRAVDAFQAQYRLARLQRQAATVWDQADLLLTPTTGTIYTIQQVLDNPIGLNTNLGYYTNFMNLLDLAAVAVPAGFLPSGLPWGVTLCAPAGSDVVLLELADRMQRAADARMGASSVALPAVADRPVEPPPGWMNLAVCGAHMAGLPLNHQLTDRGGRLVRRTRTSSRYRLYALPGGPPQRPALVRSESGAAVELEVWHLPAASLGTFLQGIPAPLGLGKVELEDGSWVTAFVCEANGEAGAEDITGLGGWRAFLRQQQQPA